MVDQTETPVSVQEMSPARRRPILFGRKVDWAIAITIMVIAIGFIFMLQSLPQRATFFPWFITISIMITGGLYSYGKYRHPDRWDAQYDPQADSGPGENDTGPAYLVQYGRGVISSILKFAALITATILIGPEFAVPLFVTLMLWSNGENKIVAVLSGIFFWLVIHFVFGKFMSINLPTGYLTNLL